MATYRLTFHSDSFGSAKFIEFEGRSAADALEVMEHEQAGRHAELSVDDRRIAILRRSRGAKGLWFVD